MSAGRRSTPGTDDLGSRVFCLLACLLFAAFFLGIGVQHEREGAPMTATTTGTVTQGGVCRPSGLGGGLGAKPGEAVFSVDGTDYPANVACDAQPGTSRQIHYNPDEPSQADSEPPSGTLPYGFAALCVIGGAAQTGGVVRALRRRRRSRRSLI